MSPHMALHLCLNLFRHKYAFNCACVSVCNKLIWIITHWMLNHALYVPMLHCDLCDFVQKETTHVCICVHLCMHVWVADMHTHAQAMPRDIQQERFVSQQTWGFLTHKPTTGGWCLCKCDVYAWVRNRSDVCEKATCSCPTWDYVKGQGMRLMIRNDWMC